MSDDLEALYELDQQHRRDAAKDEAVEKRQRPRRTVEEQAEIDAAVFEAFEDDARKEGLRRRGLT